jgi:hypothetical protein
MRRTYIIFLSCVVLLFVPIYLWQVNGWFQGPGVQPTPPLEVEMKGEFSRHEIEHLAKTDPVELLKQSLAYYKEHIQSYTCILAKQERIKGKLQTKEVIQCSFQEKPFSVLMVWKEGADRAAASLYAVNESGGKMFIRPYGWRGKVVSTVDRAPDCDEVKSSTRYLITDFGIRRGTERTYEAWKYIQDRKSLNYEYLGIQKCEQAGNRDCHVILRHCDPKTEMDAAEREEGLTEITIYIDVETGLQVGTILKAKGELIGEYYFRDIQVNPTIDPKLFTRENLKTY